ncbi:MAG: hypothetical protein ACTHOO_03255 [Alcanivorax sp.]
MSKKPPSFHAHKIIAMGLYVVMAILVIAPMSFVDPEMVAVKSPITFQQKFFLFNESVYFQPFVELLFISIASILLGLIVIGAGKVKVRAIISLVALIGIYLPFSFLIYLLPSFFDFISDMIQIGFRRVICDRHHTGIVATNKGYLYDCPLGLYTFVFVIFKNIFVFINLVILSASAGYAYAYITRMFQAEENYLEFQKYIDFCLSLFVGSVPLVFVMFIGYLFELYTYALYQVFVVISMVISFLPVINFTCDEMNPYGVVSLSIKKTAAFVGVASLGAMIVGSVALMVEVFGNDSLLAYLMYGGISFQLMFASYVFFCVLVVILMTTSYTKSSVTLADVSGVVASSLVLGVLVSVLFLDATSRVQYVWHIQNELISRNIAQACFIGRKGMDCPYAMF